MNQILHFALLVLASAFFAGAALFGLKNGHLPSIRGGLVKKEEGPFIFLVCVALYLGISVILLLSAFYWRL